MPWIASGIIHQCTMQWLIVSMRIRQFLVRFEEHNSVAACVAANAHYEMLASSNSLSGRRRQQSLAQLIALIGRHSLDIDLMLLPDTDLEGDRAAAWA
jgi:hypothetical protein